MGKVFPPFRSGKCVLSLVDTPDKHILDMIWKTLSE